MIPHFLSVETDSAEQTRSLGVDVARLLAGGAGGTILALSGDLGAGKTTFTQGLAQGLGIVAPVTSPTFVLINRYMTATGRALQHADCYRLGDAPVEMWDIGLFDMFAEDDIVVVEWADRIAGLLPEDDHLEVHFAYLSDERRRISLIAHGARYEALLRTLANAWRIETVGGA